MIDHHANGAGQVIVDFFEVFLQMPGNRLMILQHRQNVYKAEHLNFDRLVRHRPGKNVVVPPAAFKD